MIGWGLFWASMDSWTNERMRGCGIRSFRRALREESIGYLPILEPCGMLLHKERPEMGVPGDARSSLNLSGFGTERCRRGRGSGTEGEVGVVEVESQEKAVVVGFW